jgi:predicted nucleic acid-binding Zn ribbon protein
MTTYVYETIPSKKNAEPTLYEIQQSMKDEPLTHHPETGEPIRRVILGGFGPLTKSNDTPENDCSSGSGCCCC